MHVMSSHSLSSVAMWACSTLIPLQEVTASSPREAWGELCALIHRLTAILATPISPEPTWAHPTFKLGICELGTGHSGIAWLWQVLARV